jgi:hypothetical protein
VGDTLSLKLQIELVPATTWYTNLRKVLPQEEWDRVRRKAYADYGHICGICGAEGRLSCHELWDYDDERRIQKLIGFIALCDLCHHVKHIGLAGILASEGKLDYNRVVEHFMKVNKCDLNTFERHREEAFRKWQERSSKEWSVDIGDFSRFLKGGTP